MFAAFFRTLSRLIPLPHWDQADAGNVGRMSIYEMRIIQSLHHSRFVLTLEEELFKSLKVQNKKLLDNGSLLFPRPRHFVIHDFDVYFPDLLISLRRIAFEDYHVQDIGKYFFHQFCMALIF